MTTRCTGTESGAGLVTGAGVVTDGAGRGLAAKALDGLVQRPDFPLRKHPGLTRLEIAEAHRPVRGPGQALHSESQRLAPAAHDAIAAFGQGHVQNAAPLPPRPHSYVGGDDRAAVDQHAALHGLGNLLEGKAVDESRVMPRDPIAWVGKAVDRLAVIRQQQEAGRAHIQAPDVGETGRILDEVEYGPPPRLVGGGGDHTERLVESQPAKELGPDPAPIQRNGLSLGIDLRSQRGHLAVHSHPPFLDQPLRGPARRDPGLSQGPLDPHLAHDSAGT